jgi:hypothetical protein
MGVFAAGHETHLGLRGRQNQIKCREKTRTAGIHDLHERERDAFVLFRVLVYHLSSRAVSRVVGELVAELLDRQHT